MINSSSNTAQQHPWVIIPLLRVNLPTNVIFLFFLVGFLNINTNENSKSPSNFGLMDQIAALHWLQENVSVFGGDPTNVTLLGHGTGAACVNFLMTSSAVPDGKLYCVLVLDCELTHSLPRIGIHLQACRPMPRTWGVEILEFIGCSGSYRK